MYYAKMLLVVIAIGTKQKRIYEPPLLKWHLLQSFPLCPVLSTTDLNFIIFLMILRLGTLNQKSDSNMLLIIRKFWTGFSRRELIALSNFY